ncbi:MAG TPA: signal recognition particle-docking protein FtsY [Rhodanobacteraceae bacterium]
MLKFWKKKDHHKDSQAPAEVASDASDSATPDALSVPASTPATPDDTAAEAATTAAEAATPSVAETAPATRDATAPTTAADAPTPAPPITTEAPRPAKRSWRQRLAGSGFARGLSGLFTHNAKLDDDLLDELETVLITADVGVNASMALVEDLRRRMHKREFADADALLDALRAALVAELEPVQHALDITTSQPFVLLVVGVNGVGKTTTIGKLTHRYRRDGHKVLLAAGDTFRAAAVEQLKAWGARNDVPVLAQGQGSDSASVIYDALDAARARGSQVLIADTAGRLHTQSGLMDELAKIVRVLRKLDADAPHEVLMVIDGTTGQNAINQLRQFHQSVGVTGLVVTKLDGTAKGGVMFALAREFGLPIRYVGLGEGIDDLRVFDARAFVDGLLPAHLGQTG